VSPDLVVSVIALATSALSVLAVLISLNLQRNQTRISQLQQARSNQLELFRLAYEHADLQQGWGDFLDVPYPEWRVRTYMNLVFNYMHASFVLGEITPAQLRRQLDGRFRTSLSLEYWRIAAPHFRSNVSGRRSRQFYQIVQAQYQKEAAVAAESAAGNAPETPGPKSA
jgi:Family of unknown function (DUF6082)